MTDRQKLVLDFIKKDIQLSFEDYKNGIIKVDVLKIDFAKYVCSIYFDDLFIEDICQEINDKGYYCRYSRFHSFIDRTILTIKETPFEKTYFDIENGKIIKKLNYGFKKIGYDTFQDATEGLSWNNKYRINNEPVAKKDNNFWKKIFKI